jgi:hypothetical protein
LVRVPGPAFAEECTAILCLHITGIRNTSRPSSKEAQESIVYLRLSDSSSALFPNSKIPGNFLRENVFLLIGMSGPIPRPRSAASECLLRFGALIDSAEGRLCLHRCLGGVPRLANLTFHHHTPHGCVPAGRTLRPARRPSTSARGSTQAASQHARPSASLSMYYYTVPRHTSIHRRCNARHRLRRDERRHLDVTKPLKPESIRAYTQIDSPSTSSALSCQSADRRICRSDADTRTGASSPRSTTR